MDKKIVRRKLLSIGLINSTWAQMGLLLANRVPITISLKDIMFIAEIC